MIEITVAVESQIIPMFHPAILFGLLQGNYQNQNCQRIYNV